MKQEIEQQLGCEIPETLYQEACTYAKNKQAYIYSQEGRTIVFEDWYLKKLVEEYVVSLALSSYTMDLCVEKIGKQHRIGAISE